MDRRLSSKARLGCVELLALAEAPVGEYPMSAEGFGAVHGLSAGDTPAEFSPIIVVPRFVSEMIEAQERCASDKAPNLTIAQWLHAQPPAVQRRERLRVLRKLGLVAL